MSFTVESGDGSLALPLEVVADNDGCATIDFTGGSEASVVRATAAYAMADGYGEIDLGAEEEWSFVDRITELSLNVNDTGIRFEADVRLWSGDLYSRWVNGEEETEYRNITVQPAIGASVEFSADRTDVSIHLPVPYADEQGRVVATYAAPDSAVVTANATFGGYDAEWWSTLAPNYPEMLEQEWIFIAGGGADGSVVATGGSGSFVYEKTGGALPTGVAFSPDGNLSGQTQLGSIGVYGFTVRATDQVTGAAVSQSFSIQVDDVPPLPGTNPAMMFGTGRSPSSGSARGPGGGSVGRETGSTPPTGRVVLTAWREKELDYSGSYGPRLTETEPILDTYTVWARLAQPTPPKDPDDGFNGDADLGNNLEDPGDPRDEDQPDPEPVLEYVSEGTPGAEPIEWTVEVEPGREQGPPVDMSDGQWLGYDLLQRPSLNQSAASGQFDASQAASHLQGFLKYGNNPDHGWRGDGKGGVGPKYAAGGRGKAQATYNLTWEDPEPGSQRVTNHWESAWFEWREVRIQANLPDPDNETVQKMLLVRTVKTSQEGGTSGQPPATTTSVTSTVVTFTIPKNGQFSTTVEIEPPMDDEPAMKGVAVRNYPGYACLALEPLPSDVPENGTVEMNLLPVEVVSRDKFLGGGVEIPAGWDNLAMEFVGPNGEDLGKYGSLLGGGTTKIYDKVTDILSEDDIAAGGQPSSQKVWFVRDGPDSRKIDFYTCFNSVGQAQIRLFPDGGDSEAVTITYDLTEAQDFADTIAYVDAWVKGTSFDWAVPPLSLPPAVLALASQAADDPSASHYGLTAIANSLASGAILTTDTDVPLAPESASLTLGEPLADVFALENLASVQILPLDAILPASPLSLEPGSVYWLADGVLHSLTEAQVTALSSQTDRLVLAAPPPPPAPEDSFASGISNETIDNLTRAALIPFFNVINQVEGLGNVAYGLFEGVRNGLQDDWKFLTLIGDGLVASGDWALQRTMTEIQEWHLHPIKRASELKQLADKVCEDMVFKPLEKLGQAAGDFTTWNGFKKRSWQAWEGIKRLGEWRWTVEKNMWSAIVDGLAEWGDDFCDRMLMGAEKVHWNNSPWVKYQILDEINSFNRQACYTFGYTFGYLCEQVAVGALTAGTTKLAQVAAKGGVSLAANLAKRTAAAVAARAQWLKTLLAEAGAVDAVLRAAYERGLVMCAVEPVGPTIKEVIFEVIEKAFSKPAFNRSIYSWKHLQDDILQRPNLGKLVRQQGGEVVFQRRLSQLATILGEEFDAMAAKNFAKVADEIILVQKPDGTVDEFFESFFRAFDGNPSSMVNADIGATFSKSGLSAEGKATLKKFLSDPNAGKLWEIDVPAIVDNEPAIPDNYWIRGILGELAIYKRIYKNAGYDHFPTATAFDLKSAAEYVQIKTLKNPDGAISAMRKAIDALMQVPPPPNGLKLHILKKPGSGSSQLKPSLDQYIQNHPSGKSVTVVIDEFDLIP